MVFYTEINFTLENYGMYTIHLRKCLDIIPSYIKLYTVENSSVCS